MKRKRFPSKKERKKPGPKSGLTDEVIDQVEKLAKLGATDKQIADFFGKNVTTLEKWIRDNDELYKARKRGGIEADTKVAESMYKRAVGYSYIEAEYRRNELGEKVLAKETLKHQPGDPTAQKFWLANRQRELWADVSKVQYSGQVEHRHMQVEDIPVEELTPGARKLLKEINTKQLSDGSRSN